MMTFDNMKAAYTATVQCALASGKDKYGVKQVNELLHKFCEQFVDSSNLGQQEKALMKRELLNLKIFHDQEIESLFKN